MSLALLRAPRVRLSWTASSLGIYFGGYRVKSRPARMPFHPWITRGDLTVPTGYDRATVAAQHIRFDDYLPGWYSAGGEWESGHDYVVTEYDISGAESQVPQSGVTVSALTIPDAGVPWWVTNHLPFLNCPLEVYNLTASDIDPGIISRRYAGRDKSVNLSRAELPGRTLTTTADFFSEVGPDELRCLRYAMKSRLQFAMHRPLGDRIVGTPYVSGFSDAWAARQTVNVGMIETIEDAVAQYNLPAGVVLNGTSQYLTTPSATQLNPGSSAFSVVVAARFANTGSTKYAVSKGNIGTAAGYAVATTGSANELQFKVVGASATATATYASVSWSNDVRVAVGTTSGTTQNLYMDGASVATGATTHGAVTNSVALVAGANNAGASGFMAAAPLRAYAVYLRELTATEALNASRYLLGMPGYRMPAGASIFVDLRDDRAWNGATVNIKDLSPWANTITAVATPATRGIPWPLSQYESL